MNIRQAALLMTLVALSIATVLTFVAPGPPFLRPALTNQLFVTPEGNVAERLVEGEFYLWNGALHSRSLLWRWRAQAAVVSGLWLGFALGVSWGHSRNKILLAILVWAFAMTLLANVHAL